MSGDFAVTDNDGDFTELAVWGVDPQGRIYVLDWWSKQATSDVWVDALLDLAEHWKPMWFVGEMGPIRRAVEPLLALKSRERKVFVATQWLAHEGNKEAHSVNFQGLCSAGYVYWPKFDWAERVINQLLRFPAARHDDAVDACSLFGRFIHKTWKAVEPAKEPAVDFARMPTIGEMMQPRPSREGAL
jgi:predicted phage terminase large subunit-like protein